MTEATDRPLDPASTVAADEAPKAYGSISALAICGFAVAVIYCAFITLGSLISLFYRTPWILPLWSLVFPLVAVVLCWAARSGIASSEGALTGTKLTTWGLYLGLGFGLLYAAYYAASYLSVSQMATGFADEWLEDLKTDQLDKAFLMTMPPPRPNPDADLRGRLERDQDRGPQGRGKYSDFRQSQFVRQFEQGDKAHVQYLGAQSWGYEVGGYKVELIYRITTAAMITEIQIQAASVDNADDGKGRQWFVKDFRPLKQTMTPEGARFSAVSDQARQFAQKWIDKVADWQWEEAYLDTLPPTVRTRQRNEKGADFKEGLAQFRTGNLVHVDPAIFWAAEKEKGETAKQFRMFFGHGEPNPDTFTLLPVPPTHKQDDQQVRFGFDFGAPMPPNLAVQARLVVAAEAGKDELTPGDWRIDSLELISAKSVSEAMTPGRPPGAPPDMTPPLKP